MTRLIIGVAFGMFGFYIVAMNWGVFVNNYILKRKWTSAVPLVGGGAVAVCMVCLPVEGNLWKYAWIPLFVDWGSIPVIVAAIICHSSSAPLEGAKDPKSHLRGSNIENEDEKGIQK